MHTHVSNLAAIPASTGLRAGEWRCYPLPDFGHFACVNTADAEILTAGMTSGAHSWTNWRIWTSQHGSAAGKDEKSFFAALRQRIPDTPENAAAYQVVRLTV